MDTESILEIISNPDLLPQRSKHYGVFYGFVEDVYDPLKIGRLRIRTPHYYGLPADGLPWATYSSPGNGGDKGNGFYFLPPRGSMVSVSYVGGDPEYPMWLGGVPGAAEGVADTHVASLDPLSPYGQSTPGWDYTRFNSITTPGGHRIILDDNLVDETQQNVRRIVVETSRGNYFRMVESRDVSAGNNNPLIELGTVDFTGATVRRIALDDEARKVTITAPDSVNYRPHFLEINTPEDFIQLQTSKNYVLKLDDGNSLVDLYATRELDGSVGPRLRFDTVDNWIEVKTEEERFGIVSRDIETGFIGMVAPYDTVSSSRKASIVIDRGPYGAQSGDPVIIIASGRHITGSNGILVDPGLDFQRSQSVALYGQGTTTDGIHSSQDTIKLVSMGLGTAESPGDIIIGRTNGAHTIRLVPTTVSISVKSLGSIDLQATTSLTTMAANTELSDGVRNVKISAAGIELASTVITMRGTQVHDYFQHYHELSMSYGSNSGKLVVTVGGPGQYPVTDLVPNASFLRTSWPKG